MTSPGPEIGNAQLLGFGHQSWTALQELLGPAVGWWADLDGWHHGALPATTPLSSHLWAWHGQECWRLRIDGSAAVVARLAPPDTPPPASADAQLTEHVTVRRGEARSWPADDQQVHPRKDPLPLWTWELFEVVGPGPITFVRPHGNPR